MSQPKELTGEVLPPTKNLVPRDYQVWAYNWIAQAIRKYEGPFFVEASVGAGKTAIMAMILAQCQLRNMSVLVLARRGELVEQNADAFWDAGVQNSIFSSSVGVKATKYPIIVGSEGTVARALDGALKDFCPAVLIVDECLTGDSMIRTDDGEYRIDDPALASKKIMCISSSGEIFFDKPKRVFSNGVRDVCQFQLSDGRILKCTNTHKLYVKNSWVPAQEIKTGTRLHVVDLHSNFISRLLRAVVAVTRKLFRLEN